ncbi:MAG TPA: hypothetical protein VGO25_00165 [Rhodanobacteraceae bacterium]|nr:hypothetical protein [Rhodanobacteraceae bacterium]
MIAPRPKTPIEFEIASETGIRTGYFQDSMFYCNGDPDGYPRRMIRRWRYLDDASARMDFAVAITV